MLTKFLQKMIEIDALGTVLNARKQIEKDELGTLLNTLEKGHQSFTQKSEKV